MKTYKILVYLLPLLVFFTSACVPDVNPSENNQNTLSEITIPEGFDFSTHKQITVTINDYSEHVKYEVFTYSEEDYFVGNESYQDESGSIVNEDVFRQDVINKKIFTGVPVNGVISQTLIIPTYCQKLYIRRNEQRRYSASIVDVINLEVNYSYSNASRVSESSGRSGVEDYLYCVNGSGELFQVDPLNGNLTMLSEMPMGSWTAAIDQENKMLYSIGRSSPFPLMKYSIENQTWGIVANLGIGGPRLDYNNYDGLLYFSNRDDLYTINPTTGQIIDTWDILGLHNINGGDLAFAEDGTLFLCTFSGLYRLELNENNQYESERISADNLPFQPTSMTFDSNQELWLANNASSSDLIIMDTQTGGWQYEYGISAGNNTNLGRTINDLTTFRIFSDTIDNTDTDGDGILDVDDSYPNDVEKAFEIFTPSRYGTGTVAFEDLWPSYGDYDFNDVALNYRAVVILNANNMVVQIDFICNIKSNGAGFTNGVGIEIEALAPSQIETVSGTTYSQDYILLNPNGTEANQDRAVIIFTDDSNSLLNETTVSIKLTEPITTEQLGAAPFNPFIIVNKQREKEVHLPYYPLTDLGNPIFTVEGFNADADGNHISDNGLPWAISIIHDFKMPKEGVSILNAYNFFTSWAESGGINHNDWYKDNPGYRNNSNIAQ